MKVLAQRSYVLLAAALFLTLALVAVFTFQPGNEDKAYSAGDQTVSNGAGDDTTAIQNAIDASTGGTVASPTHVFLNPESSAGCYTVSKVGAGSGITFDSSDQHIIIESTGDASNRACIKRNVSANGTDGEFSGTEFDYFAWANDPGVDIRFKELRIDGNYTGPLDVDPNAPGKTYDWAFSPTPDGSGSAPALSAYTQYVTFNDVQVENMRGGCLFGRFWKLNYMGNFDCPSPEKGGIEFSFGSIGEHVDGTAGPAVITDSSATQTGDDSIAFNSCFTNSTNAECAQTRNFEVKGTDDGAGNSSCRFSTRGVDSTGGMTFHIRGAKDITLTNCYAGYTSVGPNGDSLGAKKGSLGIEAAPNSGGGTFSSAINILVNSSGALKNEINAHSQSHGIYLDGPFTNVRLGSTLIHYNPNPRYGVFKQSGSTSEIIGAGTATYDPNNATWNKNF